MASNSGSNQLVVFDGDEDRIQILDDDVKQLSKIPSASKILLYSGTISGVSVRQSSNDNNIEKFLNKEVDNYSFILVVCGPNPSYAHLFSSIWKKYGHKKLYVIQSDITMKNIFTQLRQHKDSSNGSAQLTNDQGAFHNYLCVKCGRSFSSDDDLQKHAKDFHGLVLTRGLYMDSATNVASHKKTNENDKLIIEIPMNCSICNDDFKTNGDLKQHIKKMHSDPTEDDYI